MGVVEGMKILLFLGGLLLGEVIGVFVTAILAAASYDDDINGRD